MNFATIGHLMYDNDINMIPKEWVHGGWIYSPQINLNGVKGQIAGLDVTARELMEQPADQMRKKILELAVFLQDNFDVDLIQLGGLTTSVTKGGKWLIQQREFHGFVNHGDSYTAAVTCKTVHKVLNLFRKDTSELTLAMVGAYGIIGEAVSKLLVPEFKHSILIGRREHKLQELKEKLKENDNIETTTEIKTKDADVIVTATNHPTTLLSSHHLKKNAIVVDVSQPPNLGLDVCKSRPDVFRIDGGFVDLPKEYNFQIPGLPRGKIFACVAEVFMQALENEKKHHVGTIDLNHLSKTEKWAEKHGFTLNELTNFAIPINLISFKI